MEILIIIGGVMLVFCIRQLKNKRANSIERTRAQFNSAESTANAGKLSIEDAKVTCYDKKNTQPIEEKKEQFKIISSSTNIEKFTPQEARKYFFEQKSKGHHFNENTYRLLANIIGKEYETNLLKELENLHPSCLGKWIDEKRNQGLFFSYSVYDRIIILSKTVNEGYTQVDNKKKESHEAIKKIEQEKSYILSLSTNDLSKYLDIASNAQVDIKSLEFKFNSSSNYQIQGFYYLEQTKYYLSKTLNFYYPSTIHYHEGYKLEKEGLLEKAFFKYNSILDLDGDPVLFYQTAERGSIILRKLKRHNDDLEFLLKCVNKLDSLPSYAGTETEHIERLKIKLNERIEKTKTKIK